MKHTAVEWLGIEITKRITRRNPHDTIIIQTQGEILIELLEQAKEMESEQRSEKELFTEDDVRKAIELSRETHQVGKPYMERDKYDYTLEQIIEQLKQEKNNL